MYVQSDTIVDVARYYFPNFFHVISAPTPNLQPIKNIQCISVYAVWSHKEAALPPGKVSFLGTPPLAAKPDKTSCFEKHAKSL